MKDNFVWGLQESVFDEIGQRKSGVQVKQGVN